MSDCKDCGECDCKDAKPSLNQDAQAQAAALTIIIGILNRYG